MVKRARTLLIAMYVYLIIPNGYIYIHDYFADSMGEINIGLALAMLALCLLFLFIAEIFNIKSAIELFNKRDYNRLRSEMKMAKLGSILFFLAEFIILVFMAVGFSILGLFFIWTIGGPIALAIWLFLAVAIVYTAMLACSSYGIAFIALLRKEGMVNTGIAIILIMTQFVPIVDLAVTIALFLKYRKRPEEGRFLL